jgi:hypothetical protein
MPFENQVMNTHPRRHWATDPTQRRLFVLIAPAVTAALAGIPIALGMYGMSGFVISWPLLTVGFIVGGLWLGDYGAAVYEGRTPPSENRVKALIALVAGGMAIPIAYAVSESMPVDVVVTSIVAIALGTFIVVIPKSVAANLILVPLAILTGAGAALLMVIFGSFLMWSGAPINPWPLLVVWIMFALLAYLFVAESAGRFTDNQPTREERIAGMVATVFGSAIAMLLVWGLLGS